jgi:hypothetical protein
MHRFLWDMHYAPLPAERPDYPMQAIYHDTPPAPSSPWVMPGNFTAKLTVNGKSYTESLAVKMDPRVRTTQADLLQQYTLSKQLYDDMATASKGLEQVRALREKLRQLRQSASQGGAADAITAFDQKLAALEGAGGGGRGGGGRGAATGPDTIATVNGSLGVLMRLIQEADVAPTTQAIAASADRRKAMASLLQRWATMKSQDLVTLNTQLKQAGLSELKVE